MSFSIASFFFFFSRLPEGKGGWTLPEFELTAKTLPLLPAPSSTMTERERKKVHDCTSVNPKF